MAKFGVLMLLVVGLLSGVAAAQDQPYAGVTVTVLTQEGPSIAEPLLRRAPEFAALTGAAINVVTVPFAKLNQTILDDQASGAHQYDAWVFAPQWMVDYVLAGYLEDLTPYVEADAALLWEDIAPFFRDFSAMYDERIYTVPLDGDFHMVYYRRDILEAAGLAAPKTWDDYLSIAAAVDGIDMNGDGEDDYGSCIAKKPGNQSYQWITSIAGAYLQSLGTSQGVFFDLNTFEPLVNNEAFIRALEIYAETAQYGPADELELGVNDTRALFVAGRCALTIDWGNIGTLAVDETVSVVKDKVGSVVLPGSATVLDRATGKLAACDRTLCPYAINNVNYGPFAAFGGWSGGVSASADPVVKQAAYAFLSYLSQPAQSNQDVTVGASGFNPYRISQFQNLGMWVASGFSETAAKDYLRAIEISLSSPNIILDLRIPQNYRYQQVILDAVLNQFLAGKLTAAQAAQTIYDQWEGITEQLGRDAQFQAYKSAIGRE